MADRSFAIHMQHRPRRVAFLVDLDHVAIDEILGAVLRFNLDSWGGRHNPIIPLVNKQVPDSYYPLLDVADPDVFYVYGEMDKPGIEEIHHRYSPTYAALHTIRQPVDSQSYSVRLREQVSIEKSLRGLRNKVPLFFRRSEPCVLQLDSPDGRSLSPFFLWNFGYAASNYFAIQNHGVPGCRPTSTNDEDLLGLLVSERNLAWPIHVCADAPLARTAGDSSRFYLPIFFGPSPWNLIAYWNDALFTGPTSAVHGGISQLWLTQKTIEDVATYQHLLRLIQLRVRSGNHQKRLRMISYDTNATELERLGKKIAEDTRWTLHYDLCARLDPTHVDTFKSQRVTSFTPSRGEIEYATGKSIHLTLGKPPDVPEDTDQCWMVDVQIYNPDQELWYGNAVPWWRLPRKASITGLFDRLRPQRIISDNRVSFEISGREATLDFEIPSNPKLFRQLLSPDVHYYLAGDLRSGLRDSNPYEIRLSDKGRYLSGILGLSDTLRETFYLFEHPFWRSLLQELSQRAPSKHLTEKLGSDIRRLLKNPWLVDMAATESWLVDEVILASKHLSGAPMWRTFDDIQALYQEFAKSLEDDEEKSSSASLRSNISQLTEANMLFQGVELRCPNCISTYWYSVEEMVKKITCRGCHFSFPLPAETVWSYQLNELVRAGISQHGLLPVLRTLVRLFDRADDCFFFTPSVEFILYPEVGDPRVEHELDLAWIKDGVFGIAEVKNTTSLFKGSDYEDIAARAKSIRPDVVLIAAPEGKDEDMVKGKKIVEENLVANCEVWAWGPEQFKRSPHWTRM